MPSYDMLTDYDFLDINKLRDFEATEGIYYWEPDGTKVNEGFSRNFVADFKNGLASWCCLWQGEPIDDQPYRVISSKESWYVLEGRVSLTNIDTGKILTAEEGQVVTVQRGEELKVDATAFRVLFIVLNMPEKDMAKMTGQDSEFALEPIAGDGPTGEGPKTKRNN